MSRARLGGAFGRWVGASLVVVVCSGLVAPPRASGDASEDTKKLCLNAYENAQILRKQAKLLSARDSLRLCAKQECPTIFQGDCITWLEEVEKAIPSVIFQTTVDDVDHPDVAVFMDGQLVTNHLDGKAVQVDPGQHAFRFETQGFPAKEIVATIGEGERFHAVKATFESDAYKSSKAAGTVVPTYRPVPTFVWIFGAVTVVGAASFATFGLLGNKKKSDLEASCAPFCSSSDTKPVKTDYTIADVSLGVAAASFVGMAIVYFTRPEVPMVRDVAPKSTTASTPSITFGATPTTGGVALSLSGSF